MCKLFDPAKPELWLLFERKQEQQALFFIVRASHFVIPAKAGIQFEVNEVENFNPPLLFDPAKPERTYLKNMI